MTREEYRNHVHNIVDLVMDIQEASTDETYPRAGIDLYPFGCVAEVWIESRPRKMKGYSFSYPKRAGDIKPEEIIEMLQKIKAELDKKKSSASDQTRTELN